MNALSQRFDRADVGQISCGLSLLLGKLARRQAPCDALLAIGADLDCTMAAGPDESTREVLEAAADALGIGVDGGFCRGIRARLDDAAADCAHANRSGDLPGESPLERPTVNTWHAREAAADEMLEAVRAVAALEEVR